MNPETKRILSRFKEKRLVVWGDVILDEYIHTSAGRVSREAPVLIAEFEKSEYQLGGAGNVAMNILTLGARPIPVGFIGRDRGGQMVKKLFASRGIASRGLIPLAGYKTPVKSRILSGGENTRKQQVLRIDTLPRGQILEAHYRQLERQLIELLSEADGLVVSDYLFRSVKAAVLKKVRSKYPRQLLTLDSRNHLLAFRDVTVATPNEPELKAAFPELRFHSEDDFCRAGMKLRQKLNAMGILLKRGHQGMMVFEKDKAPVKIKIRGTSQIVDVTGAGDTVLAVLSLALCCRASLREAAGLANVAGGIVVMQAGAYAVTFKELQDA